MVDAGVVLEELGRAVVPGPYAASAVGAAGLVLDAGSPDDHARWLPGIADGSTIATVAFGRSPVAHVPDAVAADLLLVADGDGVDVVDAAAVTITAEETVDLTRRFATVDLDGAPGQRLAGPDPTAAVAATRDRLVIAAVVDGVGAAARALELAVAYAGERVQFDRPIGSFQAVQHLCADMLHDVELARAGAYYALWAADAAPAEERHRAAAMAKAFASDALARVGANAIQVFGGVGFTWEHDIHLFYKRLLTLQHDLGGSVEHREEVARLILD